MINQLSVLNSKRVTSYMVNTINSVAFRPKGCHGNSYAACKPGVRIGSILTWSEPHSTDSICHRPTIDVSGVR